MVGTLCVQSAGSATHGRCCLVFAILDAAFEHSRTIES